MHSSLPIVEFRHVTKRFPGTLANDRIDLDLFPGEVHVLLGENGAGKSTLVAMLAGLIAPDEGQILIDGHEVSLASPKEALRRGIGAVFQHSMLAPGLTVAENLALGTPWWRRKKPVDIDGEFKALGDRFGIHLDPEARVAKLSLGERQQVEIFKNLMRGSRLLVLDEATAMLTPRGAEELGRMMRALAAEGIAVLFITHKLKEACAFGDRLTVLRLGRKVGVIPPERVAAGRDGALDAEIVEMMFGMAADGATKPRPCRVIGDVVLAVAGLTVRDGTRTLVDTVDLTVRAGEILGIAGIDGNGQKELAEALAGQRTAHGRVMLGDDELSGRSVGDRRRAGLRYVTDDRLGEGTVAPFGVDLNLVLKEIGRPPFWRRGVIQPPAIDAQARRLIKAFDVRTPGPATPIGRLSGGNIQKAVLARELSGTARAVIYNKPCYGLDVRNIEAVRDRLRADAEAGIATLLISTDLDEILELADRILVMSHGRIAGSIVNGADARRHVGQLMIGADRTTGGMAA